MPRLLLVLLVALCLSAGELRLSDLTYVPRSTDFSRRDLVVVGGGDGFLVLWTENLFGAYHPGWYGRAYDADGNPLQPEAGFIGSPYAVWTGERYLVIDPTEYVPRGQFYYPVPLITVRQFHRDGTPAARERGYLEGMTWSEVFSVFWDGTHVMALVKVEHKRVLRFDRHGALVGDTRVDDDVVAIAPNGSSLFQLRGTERRVMAGADGRYAIAGPASIAIVHASGVEVDNVPIAARTLSWDGRAWHTAYLDGQGRVCTASFTRSTDVRRDCRVIPDATQPAVGAIPGRTLLAWEDRPSKQILTGVGIASMTHAPQTAYASTIDATGLLAAWYDRGIQLGGLRHDGTRRETFVIPDTRAHAIELAANGDQSLIVWRAVDELFAMRLEANGAPLHPILPLGRGRQSDIVPNGDGWLVVRADEERVVATTISREAVLTGEHVVAERKAEAVDVAAAGDGFLVATGSSLQRLDRHGIAVGAAVGHEAARRLDCARRACLVAGADRIALVDHEGRPLREPQRLELFAVWNVDARPDGSFRVHGSRQVVLPGPNGSFRVYTAQVVVAVAPDGAVRGTTEWSDEEVAVAGVEVLHGRTWFLYTRDGVVYLRDLPPRSRAVRH